MGMQDHKQKKKAPEYKRQLGPLTLRRLYIHHNHARKMRPEYECDIY